MTGKQIPYLIITLRCLQLRENSIAKGKVMEFRILGNKGKCNANPVGVGRIVVTRVVQFALIQMILSMEINPQRFANLVQSALSIIKDIAVGIVLLAVLVMKDSARLVV